MPLATAEVASDVSKAAVTLLISARRSCCTCVNSEWWSRKPVVRKVDEDFSTPEERWKDAFQEKRSTNGETIEKALNGRNVGAVLALFVLLRGDENG